MVQDFDAQELGLVLGVFDFDPVARLGRNSDVVVLHVGEAENSPRPVVAGFLRVRKDVGGGVGVDVDQVGLEVEVRGVEGDEVLEF